MFRLTLEWQEADRNCSQTLSWQSQTKQAGCIRLGRDRDRCDVVFQHPDLNHLKTVSGLHIELFWHEQAQQIYLRNLTRDRIPPNPVVVDRRLVIAEEVPIAENSTIKLGKMTLRVKALELSSHQASVTPPYRYVCKCSNPKGAHLLPADYALLTCHCGYQVLGATVVQAQ